jgi:hypothetical protein
MQKALHGVKGRDYMPMAGRANVRLKLCVGNFLSESKMNSKESL